MGRCPGGLSWGSLYGCSHLVAQWQAAGWSKMAASTCLAISMEVQLVGPVSRDLSPSKRPAGCPDMVLTEPQDWKQKPQGLLGADLELLLSSIGQSKLQGQPRLMGVEK